MKNLFWSFDLLSSLDEEADSGISVSDCVKNRRSFDVATVDVVHSQNAIVDSENNLSKVIRNYLKCEIVSLLLLKM